MLFRALDALEHPISITVTNELEPIESKSVIGLPSATYSFDDLGRRAANTSDVDLRMRSFFKSLEKVVAGWSSHDRRPLNGLRIHMRRRPHTTADAASSDFLDIKNPSGIYTNLRTFHLYLDLEALRCQMTAKSIKDLFKATTGLEELSLMTSCTGTRPIGPSTLQCITKLFGIETNFELRVLIVQDVPCTVEDLLLLMGRHKKTLVDVKFSRVTLLGSWR